MKRLLRAVLPLLLCLSLCLILLPGAFAADAGLTEVRFTNEKGYDLTGLRVLDTDGRDVTPADTGAVYRYLLTPGAYSYSYHDDRDIFVDIAATDFAVGEAPSEIPVTLTAVFEENYVSGYMVFPTSHNPDEEAAILAVMPTREEFIDRLVDRALAEDASGTDSFSLSDSEVFSTAYESSGAAEQMRSAMRERRESTTITFYSNTAWANEDWDDSYYHALLQALAHTGNHREGDTLKEVLRSSGFNGSGRYSNGVYQYTLDFSFLYLTNAQQEQTTAQAVEDLVSSLGILGKSDYEKVYAIHDWLYKNVNYDTYNNRYNPSYPLQYTDYAALIDRCAVCQGFATAFYRLCLAAGLDARYVSSAVFNHGWNIVRVDGKYYEMDCTWDSNRREDGFTDLPHYFLRGEQWWLTGHTNPNDDSYSTIGDEFNHDSYTLVNPEYLLSIKLLQEQYAEFDGYRQKLSMTDYVPGPSGIAVNETNFPDSVFRAYVSANFDTDGSGYLSDEEIAAVSAIDVHHAADDTGKIASLKGVEHFTALTQLICAGNMLTELDISANTALEVLVCGIVDNNSNVFDNQLSELDVSKNKALRLLYCTNNQLSELDVSGNPELNTLYCYNNGMKQLNISGCKKLVELNCGNNQLTRLDASSNTALANLFCYNNALTSLVVKDLSALTLLQCFSNPQLGTLDVSGCTGLTRLFCQRCGLTALNTSGCAQLTQVGCANNSLTELDFSTCANLNDLGCQNNALVSLNLTGCTKLSGIGCGGNQLNTLDLSSCVNLCNLICDDNPMTTLDLSSCPALVRIFCTVQPTEADGLLFYSADGSMICCASTLSLFITDLLELPAGLTDIEEEAFAGGSFVYVNVPSGTVSIGPRAFADCPNLAYVFIHDGLDIDPSAFADTVVRIYASRPQP